MSTARGVFRVGLAALCLACLTFAADAAAQTEGAATSVAAGQARKKAVEAERLYARKDYRGALRKLEEAFKLAPDPAFRYDLGKVHLALGHDGSALSAFERFLLDSPDAPPGRRRVALRQAESLRPRLGTVEVACDVEGAEILVDGQEHGTTPQIKSIWLNPGPHLVLVKLPGTPFGYAERIESVAGAMVQVTAHLSVLVTAISAAPVRAEWGQSDPTKVEAGVPNGVSVGSPNEIALGVRGSEARGTSWVRRAAWIATGGAVLGLVVAGVAESSRQRLVDKFNDYEIRDGSGQVMGRCASAAVARGGGPCEAYYEDIQRRRRITVGALVGGGALAVSAVVALLVSSGGDQAVATATSSSSLSFGVTERDLTATWQF